MQDLLECVTRGSAESKGIGKQALYAQLDLGQVEAYDYAVEVMAATSQLPDAQESMRAFLEKRKRSGAVGADPPRRSCSPSWLPQT